MEHWHCLNKGIWVHPYSIPPAKLAPNLRILGHFRSGNDAVRSCLRFTSTSDRFINPCKIYAKFLSLRYTVSKAYMVARNIFDCYKFNTSYCSNINFLFINCKHKPKHLLARHLLQLNLKHFIVMYFSVTHKYNFCKSIYFQSLLFIFSQPIIHWTPPLCHRSSSVTGQCS